MNIPPISRNLPKSFLVFFVIIGVVNAAIVAPYLLAVFLGWIFATVLRPFHRFLERREWSARSAAFVATLVATFTIILPIGGFGFITVKNLVRVVSPYAKAGLNTDGILDRVLAFPMMSRVFDGPEEARAFIEETSKKGFGHVTSALTGIVGAAPEIVLQLVLALLTTYFILVEGKKLSAWMGARIPLETVTRAALAKNLEDTAYSSFLSMFFAALAQAIVVLIGFLALKVPFAMLAFGVAFVCAWLPIFGVTPVWVAALIYLVIAERNGAAIGMAAFGLAASLVDNIVRPWVIKDRSDLHPLVSLVAIFGSIHFFGILGVLVGPVAAGCFIHFLKIWPEYSPRLGLKTDEHPRGLRSDE